MDYQDFLDEFDSYNEWNRIQKKNKKEEKKLDKKFPPFQSNARFKPELKHAKNDAWLRLGQAQDDRVNSPSHYTSGKQEVIDIIESAIKDAPTPIHGMLQGQVLKYILRVWLKDNPLEDMQKARWYLDRLIEHHTPSELS